jgi:hypothetical protein
MLCFAVAEVTDPPSQTTAVTFDPKAPSSTKQAISDSEYLFEHINFLNPTLLCYHGVPWVQL